MSYIRYWIPEEWNLSESKIYSSYYLQKTEAIKKIIDKKNKMSQSSLAQKLNQSLNNLLTEEELLEAIQKKNFKFDSEIVDLYQSYQHAIKGLSGASGKYFQKMENFLNIKALPNGATFSMDNKDLTSAILNQDFLKVDIKKSVGMIGEATSSIVAQNITNSLVELLVSKGGTVDNINVTYTNTGGDRVKSTFGNIGMGVQRQTDNVLDIAFSLNGVDIKLKFNISDKASIKLADPKNNQKLNQFFLRSSTINSFLKILDKNYIYNTLSYHRFQDGDRRMIQASQSILDLQRTLGHYLLYDAMKSTRILLDGNRIDDNIDFTIRGGKIVPEKSIYENILSKNNDLKASISGISGLLDGKKINSIELAEEHIRKMKVSLQAKI